MCREKTSFEKILSWAGRKKKARERDPPPQINLFVQKEQSWSRPTRVKCHWKPPKSQLLKNKLSREKASEEDKMREESALIVAMSLD